jgi:hypothetical protein
MLSQCSASHTDMPQSYRKRGKKASTLLYKIGKKLLLLSLVLITEADDVKLNF